jgi:hypothetical protein
MGLRGRIRRSFDSEDEAIFEVNNSRQVSVQGLLRSTLSEEGLGAHREDTSMRHCKLGGRHVNDCGVLPEG